MTSRATENGLLPVTTIFPTENDRDGDGWTECQFDCDDRDATAHPLTETCTAVPPYDPFTGPLPDQMLPLEGAVFYVDASAPAGGDGQSWSSAFPTIAEGVEALRTSAPGTDLVVRSGTYREAVDLTGLAGVPGDPTVIRGEDPQNPPVVHGLSLTRHPSDGYRNSSAEHQAGVFVAKNVHDVRVGGFRIEGSRGYGLYAESVSSFLITHLHTFNTGSSGIRVVGARDLNVLFNRVERAVQIGFQECLTFSDIHGAAIIGNRVEDRPSGNGAASLQSDYIVEAALALEDTSDPELFCDIRDDGVELASGGVLPRLNAPALRCNCNVDWRESQQIEISNSCVPGGEGLDIKTGSSFVVVAFNRVQGIERKFGLYLDAWGVTQEGAPAWQSQIEVHHNLTLDSGTGLALSTEAGASDRGWLHEVEVHNNIFWRNNTGIYMGDHGGVPDPARRDEVRIVRDVVVRNNIAAGNVLSGSRWANPNAEDITIRRNVFSHNGGEGVVVVPEARDRYILTENIIDPMRDDFDANIDLDPMFRNIEDCDLRRDSAENTDGLTTSPFRDALLEQFRIVCRQGP